MTSPAAPGGVARPRAVLVRAPFRERGDDGRIARALVHQLDRLGVAVQLVALPRPGPLAGPEARFEGPSRPVGAGVAIQLCAPHEVEPVAGLASVNYAMSWVDPVPDAWIAHSAECDRIVVPTGSARRAWIGAGAPAGKLRVCPPGVDGAAFGPGSQPSLGALVGRAVRFLNVSAAGPRGNVDALLRTWLLATTVDSPAALLLQAAEDDPVWRDEVLCRLEAAERALGRPHRLAAPLVVRSEPVSEPDRPRLYAAATHYLSLSHGEGWDAGALEATAAGLDLIVPDHTLYRDCLEPGLATLVPCHPVPAAFPDGGPVGGLFEHARWWEPDLAAAVAAVREAVARPPRGPDLGIPRERRLARLTWERAALRLLEVVGEVEAQGAPAHRWPLPSAREDLVSLPSPLAERRRPVSR